MPLLPVALYGLEVPCGDIIVPAAEDFPATIRITMAAIDPSEPAEVEETANGTTRPRATLKILRQQLDGDDDEENEEYMRALLAESDSEDDDEDSASDEEANGGPSDPAKSKKARKAAALKELMESIGAADSDEDMEDAEANGVKVSKKGKAKATDEDSEEDSDDDSDDSEDVEIEEFVLCTLDPEKNYQQPIDIVIGENERVFFKVTGTHNVYLTGNYVIPDDAGHNHHHEVYDSDEDEDYDLSPDEDELDLELEGEESDDLDDLEDPRITEVDSEEEVPKLVATEKKADKKGKNKRTADEIDASASLDELIAKSSKTENEEPKLSKKQLKKLKKNNGEAAPAKAEEVKNGESTAAKADKKVQFAKNLEQGPTGSAEKAKVESGKASLGVKTVNGVKIDDKKLGGGPACKKGSRVSMRYIGKLADGKVFDSNKSGKPFSFKLGAGEVIKGWDIGVAGMAVGGERRLIIPSHLAYGSKAQPGIPANSPLTFDVKLLEIK